MIISSVALPDSRNFIFWISILASDVNKSTKEKYNIIINTCVS